MIVSDSWLNSEYFSKLREHLLSEHELERIAVFGGTVFRNVALENSIFVAVVGSSPDVLAVDLFEAPSDCHQINELDPLEALREGLINPMFSELVRKITARLEEGSIALERLARINRGLHAYRTDGYGKSKFRDGPMTEEDKVLQSYHSNTPLNETYLPELRGKHVERYTHTSSGKYLSYGPWLAEARSPEFFMGPKVALRKVLGSRLSGTFIQSQAALDQSLYILIPMDNDPTNVKHALGILLSGIGSWYLTNKYSIRDKVFPWYTKRQLAQFPMKQDDGSIATLVDQMLFLHRSLRSADTPHERSAVKRQIDATDKQIDQLVYELYGLSDDEIRIVEEAAR